MIRKFVIEIEEDDMFLIGPEDLRDQIALAINDSLKIEEDVSFVIEEIRG